MSKSNSILTKEKQHEHRQNFVPDLIKSIELQQDDDILREVLEKAHDCDAGFHNSGKYYTIYCTSDLDDTLDSNILVCHLNKQTGNFNWKLIQMRIKNKERDYQNSKLPQWHHQTGRWFLFENSEDNKKTIVHSGCITHLFEESGKIIEKYYEDTQGSSIELLYPVFHKYFGIIISFRFHHDKNYGDFLVLLTPVNGGRPGGYDLCVDIVRFNDKSLSHYKQITKIEPLASFMECLYTTYLDLNLGIIYLHQIYGKVLAAFDLTGQLISTCEIYAKSMCQFNDSVFYIHNTSDFTNQSLQFFNIIDTKNKVTIMSKIPINENRRGGFVISNEIIRAFDKFYVLKIDNLDNHFENNHQFQLLNANTGQSVLTYRNPRTNFDGIQFNWNMHEIAFSRRNVPLEVVKIPLFPDYSLKHQARLACLRFYSTAQLTQHLPNCLVRYLGICDEGKTIKPLDKCGVKRAYEDDTNVTENREKKHYIRDY